MSDPQAHELIKDHPSSIGLNDVVFDCPSCQKSLVVSKIAAGHELECPLCGKNVQVPETNRVVTLAEAPETQELQAKPQWQQELISIESSLAETKNQREEAGNFYKHHFSEASRQKLRIEKLDARLKELQTKKAAILKDHPQ
jgi:hypothetical protein